MPDFVSHPWINPNAIEKRAYQEKIVQTALSANTLCVLPTGLGKTSLAVLVAAERLHRNFEEVKKTREEAKQLSPFLPADQAANYGKVLFVAPTKPLVNQHRAFFGKVMKIGPDEIVAVTGEVKPKDRKYAYAKADIVIATPQTIRNDLKSGLLQLHDFCLLVVDEAHRAIGSYAYVFVTKKYVEQSRKPLVLALTASPGWRSEKIREICSRLYINNVEIRHREDADVEPYVQRLAKSWVELELPPDIAELRALLQRCREERLKKLVSWNVFIHPKSRKKDLLRLQEQLAKKHSGYSFAAMSLLAEIMKIDHALLLLETQCLYSLEKYFARLAEDKTRAAQRLLKDPVSSGVILHVSQMAKEGREHPKVAKLKEITGGELSRGRRMIIFAQYRDTVDKIFAELSGIQGVKPVIFIGQAKKAGKGMSQKEQLDVIRRFKSGEYNALIATSIGEEGLDIQETDVVLFYEPVPSEIRMIQRTGRTARTRPGKVIVMLTRGTQDQAFYWSSYRKEKRMHRILEGMQRKNLAEFVSADAGGGE